MELMSIGKFADKIIVNVATVRRMEATKLVCFSINQTKVMSWNGVIK
ncbi:MAG: hypothetical protein ACRCS6_03540 [Turicibacter sp.]